MSTLRDAFVTVQEAAFLTGVSTRAVQHEIDERIVSPRKSGGRSSISGSDILYLMAIRKVHNLMAPNLRRQVRNAIVNSAAHNREIASIDAFYVSIASLESDVIKEYRTLERIKRDLIESNSEVLGGEPVLRGTRLSARLIAGLVRQGVSKDDLCDDYDITAEQVEAAVIFDRVTPPRGRPRRASVSKSMGRDAG